MRIQYSVRFYSFASQYCFPHPSQFKALESLPLEVMKIPEFSSDENPFRKIRTMDLSRYHPNPLEIGQCRL
jgi:hypothetical protein